VTEDLYTQADTKRVRELLHEEQQGLDLLTGLPLDKSKWTLDHRHDGEQFVRGVIHRSVNTALGRIENTFLRDLSWWYPGTLPTFLRKVSDYLERPVDTRYRHTDAIKKLKVFFNKLNSKQQDQVLIQLGSQAGKNIKERKELFSKTVLDRSKSFEYIRDVINKVKGGTLE
jgi:hypothetical protein